MFTSETTLVLTLVGDRGGDRYFWDVTAFNQFGYNDHPAMTKIFILIEIIDSDVENFGYNEQFVLYVCTKRGPV